MKIKAFSLVELLVVISIISIISFVSISSFFNFAKTQEINSKIMLFEDELKELDKKIKNKEIFDYKVEFETNSVSSGTKYKIIENSFDLDNYITISQIYGTGRIKLNSSKSFYLKVFKGKKLKTSTGISNYYDLKIDDDYDYKIVGYLTGTVLKMTNSIYIKRYDKTGKSLFLYQLTDTKTPKTDIGDKIILQNISSKKSFSGTSENKIKLNFMEDGVESFLELDYEKY